MKIKVTVKDVKKLHSELSDYWAKKITRVYNFLIKHNSQNWGSYDFLSVECLCSTPCWTISLIDDYRKILTSKK